MHPNNIHVVFLLNYQNKNLVYVVNFRFASIIISRYTHCIYTAQVEAQVYVLHCLHSSSKNLSVLASFPTPQRKSCFNPFNYSVTAATSPIIVEVGLWRGETSDATPENKNNQENPNNIATLAEIEVKQFSSRQQGSLRQ